MKKMLLSISACMLMAVVMAVSTLTVHAEEIVIGAGVGDVVITVETGEQLLGLYRNAQSFEPSYYANGNPDVKAAYGYADYALYYHYITYGRSEGRKPYKGALGGEFAKWKMTPMEASVKVLAVESGIPENDVWKYFYADNSIPWYYRQAEIDARLAADPQSPALDNASASAVLAAPVEGIVTIKELSNYNSLKKKMTDAEFQAAYNEALKIVRPLVGLSREEQAKDIYSTLRAMADNGTVSYSEEAPHYNDAYGYLVDHTASCAGSARTTGLCLNMLGISYEHVNENQWTHQWCRININGTMWIVDPYGMVCAPESAPYAHPLL